MNCFVTLTVLRSHEKKSYEVNFHTGRVSTGTLELGPRGSISVETLAVLLEILPNSKSAKILVIIQNDARYTVQCTGIRVCRN
jgi:hypothetical protein